MPKSVSGVEIDWSCNTLVWLLRNPTKKETRSM